MTPTTKSVLVNSKFTLGVNITSYNVKPTVEWALNGTTISEGVRTDVQVLGSGVSTLTVQNAEFVGNVERFTVNVSNLHAGGGAHVVAFEVRIVGM